MSCKWRTVKEAKWEEEEEEEEEKEWSHGSQIRGEGFLSLCYDPQRPVCAAACVNVRETEEAELFYRSSALKEELKELEIQEGEVIRVKQEKEIE